jgi:phosphatidylglycerophosphate synthase
MNVILKFLTFLPSYYLSKLKISPDKITILSYIVIVIAASLFVLNHEILACILIIFFGFLDSLDGDIARLSKNKSDHGENMDIFGADIFYFLIPPSIVFNLVNFQEFQTFFNEKFILPIGFMISFNLIFYRLIGLRNYTLSLIKKNFNKQKIKAQSKISTIKYLFNFFEHDFLRGNFFSEPGFILNFSILIFLNLYQIIFYYILIIFAYTSIRLLKLFLGTIFIYTYK